MKFICHYIGREDDYFRICYGDTINEATRNAERYVRVGYVLATVKQVI